MNYLTVKIYDSSAIEGIRPDSNVIINERSKLTFNGSLMPPHLF